MPRKAFLKKKSLLDRFKDDYATHTGYIQSARAKHTWNNPLTRRKRTKELNKWIKSFAGKDHIHKLARFNAINAGKNEDYADGVKCLRYGSSFELPDGKIITALDKAIRCRRSGAFIVYITGWVENEENDPCNSKYIVYFDTGKYEDYFLTNDIQDLPNYQTNGPIPSDNKVVKDYAMHENTNEAMSLKGFLENLTEKLTKQFDLDADDVKFYLDTHTKEMQELLDDKELSLKEKVLFVRSEITGEQDEKKSEKLVVSNPCVVYKGDAENAAKAHDYLYKKMPRVKGASISSDVKPLGNNKFCRVLFYGNNTGVMDLFGYYSNLYNDDFWNNCDADPQGWVDPLTINKYDVATPRQESNETDEKLGYEKGHKNSRGENAPWVIRSHEDNRILASFANKKDAEEHLKRMKQYSKTESKVNEEAEIKDKQYYLDMFDKAYKECVQLDIDDGGDGQNWANYFATGDEDPTTFSQKEADEIVGYYMEFHPNWEGETDRPYKDWMENIDNTPKTALDKEITRILKALYAPNESKQTENATTEEDSIRKAFKSIVNHVPANERSNFDEEFVTDNMEALLDLFNAWFVFDNGEFVTTVRVVDPDNENGDYYDADDEAYQWNACYNVTEGIIDLLGWNYGEETVKQPIQDALFYDFIGTKYIDNSNESKKSESETSSAEQAFKNAADTCGVSDKITITTNGDKVYCIMEMDEDKYGIDHYKWGFDTTTNNLEWYGDESTSGVGAKKKFDNFNDLKSWLIKDIKALFKTHRYESKDLSGYTSDIISKLDGIWACGLNGAKRLAEKYADVIQQNYTDGDLSTAETAKFIAGQENLTESCKKTESKKSEGRLELVDTIVVPKWLWEAFNFGNEYGEDLDEHEQEILAKFQEEYGKYYLDDRSEEADFRSRNDFDQYGGPCYEVDVYEMKKS